MITPLQKHPSLVEEKSAVHDHRRPASTPSGKITFQELFSPLRTAPVMTKLAPSTTGAQAAATSSGKTGLEELFTPQQSAPAPAVSKFAPSTPSTQATPAASATGTWQAPQPIPIPPITDLHNQGQVEAHMNGWLENETQNENNQKMQIYQQAMADWKANSVQYQALGMPVPPPPPPPTLDPVQPMPTGWWFQS